MFNTVELKKQRSDLKKERKALADAIRQRDLDESEQAKFDELTSKIDALSKRIELLEKVEDEEEEEIAEDEESEREDDEKKDEEDEERSHPRKPVKKAERHLGFNLSTSKSKKDSHLYSVRRALSLHAANRRIDGIEGEQNQEIALYRGAPNGFYMPWDFKLRGNHKPARRRDFTTSTGSGAVGVKVESTFIELLRNRMVTEELGIIVETNLKGKYAKPRQNAASTLYFIGEGSNGTGSTPTFDQVNFVPKTATCQVNISRKSLFEMSIDAETAVEADMLKVLAIGLDTQVLAGNGSGANPTGILYDSAATAITLTADTGNGANINFQDALNFESLLTQANADRGSIAFVTTPGIRSKLKQTPKINTGQVYPEFVWNMEDNTINGYRALVTNEMPSGLTKGSSSNLHSIIFGNWEDTVLALWGGIDVVVNPFINVSSGAVQYNLFQEVDTQRMHSNSFVISTAASAS